MRLACFALLASAASGQVMAGAAGNTPINQCLAVPDVGALPLIGGLFPTFLTDLPSMCVCCSNGARCPPFSSPLTRACFHRCVAGLANLCTSDATLNLIVGPIPEVTETETVLPIMFGDGTTASSADLGCIPLDDVQFPPLLAGGQERTADCELCSRLENIASSADGLAGDLQVIP